MNEFKRNILRTQVEEAVSPENCKKVNITISLLDLNDSIDDTIRIHYTDCSGNPNIYIANNEGTFLNVFCASSETVFALTYTNHSGVETNASNSSATLTATNCGE